MSFFNDAFKACVAGWRLLREDLRTGRIKAATLRAEGVWSPDEDRLRKEAESVNPHPFQTETYDKLRKAAEEGGVVVVEAATASGKTEAAVAAFLSQLVGDDWWLAPRLIYTQPSRALTLTAYMRLLAYSTGLSILRGVTKAKLSVSYEYGATFAYRHYLYGGAMVASTLDAAVYGFAALRVPGGLSSPRLSMPAGLIATSLFVLDEVQHYQDEHYYSPRIINLVLEAIVEAGGVALILTATMPSALLDTLLDGLPYEHVRAAPVMERRIEVDLGPLRSGARLPELIKDKEVLKEIEGTLSSGAHALVVANTVRRAAELYGELAKRFGRDRVVLLHGRLANWHREEREGGLFSDPKVVVSTQVVEAGFDFDALLLLTELAPMDSLVQRAGRVARRGSAPGKVVIADIESGQPYHDQLLKNTKNVLLQRERDFAKALDDVEAARSLLDGVYTTRVIEDLKSRRPVLEAERYLRRLRLLSFPPEEDFSLREGFYVTLVVPEVLESSLKEMLPDVPCHFSGSPGVLLEIPPEKEEVLLAALERSSLTLSLDQARRLLSTEGRPEGRRRTSGRKRRAGEEPPVQSNIAGELRVTRKREKEFEKNMVRISVKDSRARLRPLRTYLLSKGVYNWEQGLVMGE